MNIQEQTQYQPQKGKWFQSRITFMVLLGFIAIGAFFLITGHSAYLFGLWPFALFLLCPLMMLFMHGGHGGNGKNDGSSSGNSDPAQPPEGDQQ